MAASTQSDPRWPWPLKAVASLALVVYLAAVIVPPLAGPPPASDLARAALGPLRPLVHALGLDHGYRFFAPNPGPGHSIRWTITRPDGSTAAGTIPDRDADWPRLLYHRRFMVPEKIAARVPPADAPAEVRHQARADWEPLVRGVARNLIRAHDAASVRLELVEHYLSDPAEVVRGEQGADSVTPLGEYARGSVAPPGDAP